ncbi:His-Xaa-Ser system radical SAM maturase HxsB [Candidatus Falkowbacteria bacterium RIFOXYB2_FULL_34_18]|uniref:His-Xaa-Ser system radical SAM maturase HxsB n=1 Tax=Candidatus Falkowbacteria bacterium RIFOXYD2_FULL_34_120 TaxID=1798007 RepID=A0A1F5TQE4_9BACT|nr:MAG: His-Xaa-Ser system radical SAM maturase HxsB [Candidatus Falkowbacteria bacterium RIFOXYB2_FULL_34_18]OGF29412.1 MAG: His-Xaa-Ser system radical SAM maturase HxsB [Candidatus Falkowbacteria bacterium RIFOXYC12_FULL_34_55]OGF36621.1 MAG: His-Xaa-Ser system radical SAM maturase HxsB [Candidatus Falkowbacteria bacterium RIFOXYC2_FULL_34_220]OGF38839.1 MAG: His-Xaa-Ser system radical SAM maturase HxsB [Candidatus Falkowbacteria bacterium RIFOXYD12_FULL_34_57]OGF41087.1 MAG: His-Xaa-Ser syst
MGCKNLAFFRFRNINNEYIITNDYGDYVFLSKNNFNDLMQGKLKKNSKIYQDLAKNNFIKDKIDTEKVVAKYRTRKNYLFAGPSLHIMVVTLRCNHRCLYCHASARDMEDMEKDMTKETAKKTLDNIFKTTSGYIVIEFQGGEPLVNWPIIKFVVEEARRKNKKAKKELSLRLISNFSLMDEEKYQYLIKNKVEMCTSLDGPEKLHNKNRPSTTGVNSHKNIAKWINRFNEDYPVLRKRGYIWKIGAIVVISKYSLKNHKEIIDEYIKFGFSSLFLRPLNPFGFSHEVWSKINYSADEFIDFYKKSLDYIIERNLAGIYIVEKWAKTFLQKILTDNDPNMMEIRNPCGAGLGQLAYNYNGDVYTCDEGRMMSMMGDESFKIGSVKDDYEKIVTHTVTRTLCSASCLEGVAGCSNCAYLPYCGVCPIYNYFEQGNIFGQSATNDRCKINLAILDYLLLKLKNDKIKKEVFLNWLKK